jgi:uncharacterized protein YqjF (DUF2071 family)
MHDILGQIAHRPWPLPSAPWIMHQRWENLLFAHWRVPVARLRPLVPSAMAVEEFDGTAWVGLAPFRLTRLHARFLPPLPFASEFLEMNLRTYVRVGNKPGIFFFTLEAESRLAVAAARLTYRPGHVLQNAREVRAFADTANVVVIHGFVNRYDNSNR